MQNRRSRYLVWLTLLFSVGLTLLLSQAWAQPGFLSDFTWGFYGSSREDSRLGREDLIAREGYCPTGGCVLRLESVEVRPNRAKKGETLLLTTTYTILTPEQIAMPVSINREVYLQGKLLGRTKSVETRRYNGTWTQEIDFILPKDAAPGVYTLVTQVNTGYDSAQKTAEFQVD